LASFSRPRKTRRLTETRAKGGIRKLGVGTKIINKYGAKALINDGITEESNSLFA
jgi:hypothetical protein